uniref:Apple domain-containing protein n=1 Tax=Macrostomum lignano TaxID=282301 RepID=A0A1I8HQF0_9PLAT
QNVSARRDAVLINSIGSYLSLQPCNSNRSSKPLTMLSSITCIFMSSILAYTYATFVETNSIEFIPKSSLEIPPNVCTVEGVSLSRIRSELECLTKCPKGEAQYCIAISYNKQNEECRVITAESVVAYSMNAAPGVTLASDSEWKMWVAGDIDNFLHMDTTTTNKPETTTNEPGTTTNEPETTTNEPDETTTNEPDETTTNESDETTTNEPETTTNEPETTTMTTTNEPETTTNEPETTSFSGTTIE